MSEYIYELPDEPAKVVRDGWNFRVEWNFKQREEIVRCRDCRHATVSSLGYVKYCEMFVLPDTDGYGADPQVCLPLDFFCGYGKRRGEAE